jgi:amidohydrolase
MATLQNFHRRLPELVDQVLPEIAGIRQRLHQHPELALRENRTSALVRDTLETLGLRPRAPLLGTDVIALLEGAQPGPNVTLRADMDALPLQEQTGLPYQSQCAGLMHACGHDGHTAMLLGAAMVLCRLQTELRGSVRFVFQPGEEIVAAGRDLVAKGALLDPTPAAVFALHAWPGLPVGAICSRPGPILAAAEFFRIVIRGKGAHGSRPEDSVDPILTAARVVEALQSVVSRHISPLEAAVLSICRVSAGTNANIIPDTAELEGTTRYLNPAVGSRLPILIERLVKGVCDAMGAGYELHYSASYIPTLNDAGIVALGRRVTETLLDGAAWIDMKDPAMGGEDFAYYIRDYPGAMFLLGMGETCAPLHSQRFDFNDTALRQGIAFLVGAAMEALATESGAAPARTR